MEIVKVDIEELWKKISYTYKDEYPDAQINLQLTYWCFFEEKEEELQKIFEMSLDTILYSKFYWCTKFKQRFEQLYGNDAGVEQQQYKIIEEIAQRRSDVNWKVLQMIEDERI